MSIQSFMTRSIAIQNPPSTDDGMGGVSGSWSTASTVMGAIFPASAAEIAEWGQLGERITHRMYFAPGTSVAKKQRLQYNSRNFNVRGVITPGEMSASDTACAHVKVFAEELT